MLKAYCRLPLCDCTISIFGSKLRCSVSPAEVVTFPFEQSSLTQVCNIYSGDDNAGIEGIDVKPVARCAMMVVNQGCTLHKQEAPLFACPEMLYYLIVVVCAFTCSCVLC